MTVNTDISPSKPSMLGEIVSQIGSMQSVTDGATVGIGWIVAVIQDMCRISGIIAEAVEEQETATTEIAVNAAWSAKVA